eukprot:CAMPEP_0181188938 /NCGR_PEP_ID=MMETSP1096-20121128/11393_1 /TAXON_ID=156174 ORGANISM="Chrysochromulina ericina, Strain CCMP281" /NCGR_SAMPLE_ID=MMETSP1096 /ASSEMBLY_ACC=CAM_ASM_000453 /LENGTH=186 /DNA_ID=CAMNT_0023278053 /DNA_START=333 /DNA_END=893 /DNA_ORIENTATION=-
MFASLLIDLANVTRDTIDRRIFGCHHDPGFTQASRGFHANLVMGASPTLCSSCEANPYKVPLWSPRPSAAAAKIDTGCAFATKPSLRLTAIAGSGAAAVANRGLGSAGFVLEAHKPYEFSAFIYRSCGCNVSIELRDSTTNTTLAQALVHITPVMPPPEGPGWYATWEQINVTLVPTAATTCEAIR